MKRFQKVILITAAAIILILSGVLAVYFSGILTRDRDGSFREEESRRAETLQSQEEQKSEAKDSVTEEPESEKSQIEETEKERSLETSLSEKENLAGQESENAQTEQENKESDEESELVTESSETEVFFNGFTVGIDPGHQGSWVDMSEQEPNGPGSSTYKAKATTGTSGSYSGVPEYQLNLDISLALQEELEQRGYRTVITRKDNDTAISNAERALKAAEEGSDIYVRIHANGSDDPSVHGALGMSPSPDNPYIPQLYEDSYRLTQCILSAYCKATGFSDLGIQYYDTMTGINWSKVPVTILEMGFMTNQSDDLLMKDPEMQKKMVQGIADGIDDYFGLEHENLITGDELTAEENEIIEDDMLIEEGDPLITEEGPVTEIVEQYLSAREAAGEKWAVSIENFGTEKAKIREIYEHNGQQKMQSASVIKVFIMATVYDRMCYPYSPDRLILANEAYDGELRALLEQMITISDNAAANELITRLGSGDFQAGAEVVNEFCRENGYTSTSVGRRFLEENPSGDNYTSAADCRKILSDIYQGSCVGEEASVKMLDILKMQTNTSKIPAGISGNAVTANKTGEMPEGYGLGCIENDMALIYSDNGVYILTVLSNELGGKNEEAKAVIRSISSLVWNWMGNS